MCLLIRIRPFVAIVCSANCDGSGIYGTNKLPARNFANRERVLITFLLLLKPLISNQTDKL